MPWACLFFFGTKVCVCGHGAGRPAFPSVLMNEGEPTLDLGPEAPRAGIGIVRVSLEIGDFPVSWLHGDL